MKSSSTTEESTQWAKAEELYNKKLRLQVTELLGSLGQGGGSPGQADHHLQGVHCGLRVKKGPSLLSSDCPDYHRKVNVYNIVNNIEI